MQRDGRGPQLKTIDSLIKPCTCVDKSLYTLHRNGVGPQIKTLDRSIRLNTSTSRWFKMKIKRATAKTQDWLFAHVPCMNKISNCMIITMKYFIGQRK